MHRSTDQPINRSTTSGGSGGAGGFTLIELLVVIAIITALIAILLPSMSRAIALAHAAVCGSNLKQVGLAVSAYHVDHKRFFPGHHTNGAGAHVAWPGRLLIYAGKQRDVFFCPAAPGDARWIKTLGYTDTAPLANGYDPGERPIFSDTKFSYGYNDWGIQEFQNPHLGLGGWVGDPVHGEVSINRIRVPSDMIALADSNSDGLWDTAIDPKGDITAAGNEYPSDRHLGGAEVLFADTHVTLEPFKRLTDLTDDSVRRRWNNDNLPHPELGM